MKVFNSKLAAIGLAAFVFASCSDSNSDPGTSPARALKKSPFLRTKTENAYDL